MTLRRFAQLCAVALLAGPGPVALLFFGNLISRWFGYFYSPGAGVPNFPSISYYDEWQCLLVVWVLFALGTSIVGGMCLATLRRNASVFLTWHSRQTPYRLLLCRIGVTIICWTAASMLVAWHDNIAPLIWIWNGASIGSILSFGLVQLLLSGALWLSPAPGARRDVTWLRADEVERIASHMRGPNETVEDS